VSPPRGGSGFRCRGLLVDRERRWRSRGGGLAGATTEHICTLVRTDRPPFPKDPPTFNRNVKTYFGPAKPYSDLTPAEQAWHRHRDIIDAVKQQHRVRATAYPNLTASDVRAREQYARETWRASEVKLLLRQDIDSRRRAWADYQTNKVIGTTQASTDYYQKLESEARESATHNARIVGGLGNAAAVQAQVNERINEMIDQIVNFRRGSTGSGAGPNSRRSIFDGLGLGDLSTDKEGNSTERSGDGSGDGKSLTGGATYNSDVTLRGGCDAQQTMCVSTFRVGPNGERKYVYTTFDTDGPIVVSPPRNKNLVPKRLP